MRISPLYITILLIISCDTDPNRFDIKSSEFKKKSSHHYSQRFDDSSVQNEVEVSKKVVESDNQTEIVNIQPDIINAEPSGKKGMFSGLFNIFSSSDEKVDSLDRVINDCEERLYISTDEANSKQGMINSLISERNHLLKQLDSLQTTIVQSKRTSNRRLIDLERDQKKLKSLIEILSSEIE